MGLDQEGLADRLLHAGPRLGQAPRLAGAGALPTAQEQMRERTPHL